MKGPGRLLALAAALLLAPGALGCHFPITPERVYRTKDGELYPKPGVAEEAPLAAEKKNELVCGVKKLERPKGDGDDAGLREAGDPRQLGQDFAEALLAAKIFKDVIYPLREEKVDVVIDPTLTLSLSKNRLTNALKVFPGILLPWIDGFGFDYDHVVTLELRVSDAQKPGVVCDRFQGASELTGERYPSVLFWLGLHAGLFILLVFETVSTDAIIEPLSEKDAAIVSRDAIAWLMREFAPAARACPVHPDLKENKGAKFCVICGANLRYPILNRVDGAAPKK